LLKVLAVVVGGFYFSLFSTAYSVMGINRLVRGPKKENKKQDATPEVTTTTKVKTPKAFSDSTFSFLRASSILTGIISTLVSRSAASPLLKTPFQAIFFLFTTLATFCLGARLPSPIPKIIHPLVTCTSLTWLTAFVTSKLVPTQSFTLLLQAYKTGTSCPVHMGAGDVLLFLLGPAVVALACQMYDRKKLMRENIPEVATAITTSSFGGLFGTAFVVKLLNLTSPIVRTSLLSRNITSPLAMAIAKIMGADPSLAVTLVVVTGLWGANFGAASLDAVGIDNPVARGLGIGAAAHGLGTAAFKDEKDAFPFAAIGMALTASACTVLVSVPFIKKTLVQIALG